MKNVKNCADCGVEHRRHTGKRLYAYCSVCSAKKAVVYRTTHREKYNTSMKNWKRLNPERVKAHKAVYYALKVGKLRRASCSECGGTKTQAHHVNYSIPLDVIWLCPTHHKAVHNMVVH